MSVDPFACPCASQIILNLRDALRPKSFNPPTIGPVALKYEGLQRFSWFLRRRYSYPLPQAPPLRRGSRFELRDNGFKGTSSHRPLLNFKITASNERRKVSRFFF